MNANRYALLRDHFLRARGCSRAYSFRTVTVISYDELDRRRHASPAHWSRAGCAPGDRVAVQVDKCWEGARALPRLPARGARLPAAQHRVPEERVALFTFRRCGAGGHRRAARVPHATLRRIRPQATRLHARPRRRHAARRRARPARTFDPAAVARPDDLGVDPVHLRHDRARARARCSRTATSRSNALTLVERWGFTHDDVLLHALPIYHVHGLFVACHCALLCRRARMLWLAEVRRRDGDRERCRTRR